MKILYILFWQMTNLTFQSRSWLHKYSFEVLLLIALHFVGKILKWHFSPLVVGYFVAQSICSLWLYFLQRKTWKWMSSNWGWFCYDNIVSGPSYLPACHFVPQVRWCNFIYCSITINLWLVYIITDTLLAN